MTHLPSGDQDGTASMEVVSVTRTTPDPSVFVMTISSFRSNLLMRAYVNANRFPSGCHAGCVRPLCPVSCLGFDPSASMRYDDLIFPSRLVSKAIMLPSGDQAGCCSEYSLVGKWSIVRLTTFSPSGSMRKMSEVLPLSD